VTFVLLENPILPKMEFELDVQVVQFDELPVHTAVLLVLMELVSVVARLPPVAVAIGVVPSVRK
jgi:hypothetical protein